MPIHPAPLHYRSLQHLKHQTLRGSQNYSSPIGMSPAAEEDLEWWIHKVSRWNGRSLQATPPELEIETDASLAGWGAYCQGNFTGGRWSEPPHQRAGAASSSVCSESFPEACQRCQCSAEKQQCHHCSVYQSPRRHKIRSAGPHRERAVALVPPERHSYQSSTSTREGQSQCRFHVSPLARQSRLDSQSSPIQPHQSDVGSTGSGSFCNEILSWCPDPEAEATDAFFQDWRNLRAYAHPP